MYPITENGSDTFLADSTSGVAANIRVKLTATRTITPAAEAEQEIGVTRIASKNNLETVEVRLTNAPGSVEVKLSGTVTRGDTVKRQAAGEVGPGGSGTAYGIADGDGVDGDVIPVFPL